MQYCISHRLVFVCLASVYRLNDSCLCPLLIENPDSLTGSTRLRLTSVTLSTFFLQTRKTESRPNEEGACSSLKKKKLIYQTKPALDEIHETFTKPVPHDENVSGPRPELVVSCAITCKFSTRYLMFSES